MERGTNKKKDTASLRRLAEGRAKEKKPAPGFTSSEGDLKKLVHELQVHEIELEMQNEELSRTRNQVEEVLARYTDLYDFAPVGYLTLNEKGTMSELNLTAAHLLGAVRSHLINKSFALFVQPLRRNDFHRHMRETFMSAAKQVCELTLKRNDGTIFPAQLESVSAEVNGHPVIRTILTDTTERKRAEEQMSHLASFPQFNPHPVLELDASGKIIYSNPAVKTILEDQGIDTANETAFVPEDVREIVRNWDGKTESTLNRKVRINNRFFSETISLCPQFNVARIYAFDITGLIQAEDSLRASEERFRSMFEHHKSVMLLIDPESGAIVDANEAAARFYGYSREQLSVMHVQDINLLSPEEIAEERHRALAEQKNFFTFQHRLCDGRIRWVDVHSTPFETRGRNLLFSIIHDITARKKAEEALRLAQEELETRVRERTVELRQTNLVLREEIGERKLAEEAVRTERQRLYDVLETLAAYVVLLTPDHEILFANRVFRGLFGENKNRPCFDHLFDRTEPCEVCETFTVLNTMKPHRWEWTGPNGHIYDVRDFPFINADGPTLILEMGIDITERKRGEGELRSYKEHLEELVKERTSELGTINAQLATEVVSRAQAEEALRRTVERLAIISDTASQLLMSQTPQVIVEDLCRKVMEHLDCHVFFNFLVDDERNCLRLNAYAGIPEETARKINFVDFGGAVCECAARDACRVVEDNPPTMPDVRTELDRSFGITAYACHPLFAQGKVRGTLSFGTKSHLTFTGDELFLMKTVADQVATAMERVRLLASEKERGDEMEKRVEERTAELRDAYEKLETEIAERTRIEDQLRQSQKMEAIGTLAGGIAHDFNNILAAIIGFSEMVEEDIPVGNSSTRHIQRVINAAYRGRDLVQQILTFSRKTDHIRYPVSLCILTKETFQLLRATIPTTIEIIFDFDVTSDTVFATPVEVQQILMNLTTNAAFAMQKEGGILHVSITDMDIQPDSPYLETDMAPGEYVQLLISDTGVGIAPNVMKRVFEPFFTTREIGQGTGMGLAVVYGIVKSLHGNVMVESEPGVGSTFRVLFPKVRDDEFLKKVSTKPSPGGKEKVLFIDDEEFLVEWGQAMLERLGYEVTAMNDSTEAFEAFSSDPSQFDLVITDHTMPGITGLDLAREFLKIRPDIPVILCTGHSDAVTLDTLKEAGIREFLLKPLSKHEMTGAIRRALGMETET